MIFLCWDNGTTPWLRPKEFNNLSLPDKCQLVALIKARKLTVRKVQDVHEYCEWIYATGSTRAQEK